MKIILYLCLIAVCATACHTTTIGYLKTAEATYDPDSLVIRTVLDPVLDKAKIENEAPWVTTKIQGVLGTPPINYRIANVTATEGGDAGLFREELTIRGGGTMLVPLVPRAPQGRYKVSIEIYNEGYTQIKENAFTFIIQ